MRSARNGHHGGVDGLPTSTSQERWAVGGGEGKDAAVGCPEVVAVGDQVQADHWLVESDGPGIVVQFDALTVAGEAPATSVPPPIATGRAVRAMAQPTPP